MEGQACPAFPAASVGGLVDSFRFRRGPKSGPRPDGQDRRALRPGVVVAVAVAAYRHRGACELAGALPACKYEEGCAVCHLAVGQYVCNVQQRWRSEATQIVRHVERYEFTPTNGAPVLL